jgi:hypothetical protein
VGFPAQLAHEGLELGDAIPQAGVFVDGGVVA